MEPKPCKKENYNLILLLMEVYYAKRSRRIT